MKLQERIILEVICQ